MDTHRSQPQTTVSLDNLVGNGLRLTCNTKSAGVRSGMGDKGKMFAVGSHANLKKRNIVAFKDNMAAGKCYLGNAVKAMSTLGEMVFPHVLRVVQDLERDTKLDALPCMEKVESSRTPSGPSHLHRVGLSLDVSDKLCNASHYDVNDGSVGFAVWTESNPGSTHNWYFVLPNVFGSSVRRVGESASPFNGVAIKLTHGMAICWDGRLIRHCTSVMSFDRPRGQHAFGTFCSAKAKNILCGLSMIRDEEELARAGSLVQSGVNGTTGAGGAVVCQETMTTSGGDAPVFQQCSSDVVQQRTGAHVVGGWLDDEEDTSDDDDDNDDDDDEDDNDEDEDNRHDRQHAERILFLVPPTSEVVQHSSYPTENAWYRCLPLGVKASITVEVHRKMARAAELAVSFVNDFFDTEERRLLLVEASPTQELDGKSDFCSSSSRVTNPERERSQNIEYYWRRVIGREEAVRFAASLPNLLLTFSASFHAYASSSCRVEQRQCYCPCSVKTARPWLDKLTGGTKCNPTKGLVAEMQLALGKASCNKMNAYFTAQGIRDHLRSHKKNGDPLHGCCYIYLKHLYDDHPLFVGVEQPVKNTRCNE